MASGSAAKRGGEHGARHPHAAAEHVDGTRVDRKSVGVGRARHDVQRPVARHIADRDPSARAVERRPDGAGEAHTVHCDSGGIRAECGGQRSARKPGTASPHEDATVISDRDIHQARAENHVVDPVAGYVSQIQASTAGDVAEQVEPGGYGIEELGRRRGSQQDAGASCKHETQPRVDGHDVVGLGARDDIVDAVTGHVGNLATLSLPERARENRAAPQERGRSTAGQSGCCHARSGHDASTHQGRPAGPHEDGPCVHGSRVEVRGDGDDVDDAVACHVFENQPLAVVLGATQHVASDCGARNQRGVGRQGRATGHGRPASPHVDGAIVYRCNVGGGRTRNHVEHAVAGHVGELQQLSGAHGGGPRCGVAAEGVAYCSERYEENRGRRAHRRGGACEDVHKATVD